MREKPIIGIVGRSNKEDNNSFIKVNEDYRIAIIKSGGIPVIIVPTDTLKYGETSPHDADELSKTSKKDLIEVLKICDGIIMTGGTRWYHFDEVICKYALDNNIPILGICLGMQILGNVDNFCGNLNSDRTVKNETAINHCQIDVPYVHKCVIKDGMLRDILKVDTIKVNSRHNYHITEKEYFKIEAYSEDGLIEAISIPNHKFALGVQWHPENMTEYDNDMKKIFDEFIKKTKKC